jgi:integrase
MISTKSGPCPGATTPWVAKTSPGYGVPTNRPSDTRSSIDPSLTLGTPAYNSGGEARTGPGPPAPPRQGPQDQPKRCVKDLGRTRADSTIAGILTLLSMIMGEAVEERRAALNPCRKLRGASPQPRNGPGRRPRKSTRSPPGSPPANQALVITATYTGMRWGELAGLRRPNCKLDDARIFIDPDTGALHEVGGKLELGSPKTPAAVRDILLPPFLIDLLPAHLDSHGHEHVFTGRDDGLHRRSSFHRRHWHPAVEGDPDNGIPAIVRGLHFPDLRHSHKTWLIEDGVPEVAQAKRLGHRLPGVRGIYSHVSATVEQQLAARLQTSPGSRTIGKRKLSAPGSSRSSQKLPP